MAILKDNTAVFTVDSMDDLLPFWARRKWQTAMSQRAELRQEKHGRIKILMRNGDLSKALQFIEETVSSLGPHIGLLCDMAACQYELGLFHSCTRTIQIIKKEYLQVADILSQTSSRKSALFLAKLLEEQGELVEALEFLQKARSYATESKDLKIIASQELRIWAWLGDRKDLSEKYLLLTEILEPDDNLKIEIFHGLMWAEWSLFGFQHAEQRWNNLRSMRLNPMDQRLTARDFLEMACLSQQNQEPSSHAAAQILKETDPLPYDQFLILIQTRNFAEALLPQHTDGGSLMMKLRVLILQMQLPQNESSLLELRKKLHFILESLSPAALQIIKKIIPTPQDKNQTISLDKAARVANLNKQVIPLTSQQFLLLAYFAEAQASTLTLENAVLRLWGAKWDASYYHRLRMMIYKMNQLFQVNLGRALFTIRKDGLELENSISIQAK